MRRLLDRLRAMQVMLHFLPAVVQPDPTVPPEDRPDDTWSRRAPRGSRYELRELCRRTMPEVR